MSTRVSYVSHNLGPTSQSWHRLKNTEKKKEVTIVYQKECNKVSDVLRLETLAFYPTEQLTMFERQNPWIDTAKPHKTGRSIYSETSK